MQLSRSNTRPLIVLQILVKSGAVLKWGSPYEKVKGMERNSRVGMEPDVMHKQCANVKPNIISQDGLGGGGCCEIIGG